MADGDETTASSGGPRKLLLPTAPGPAQPLTHLGVRFRKQLDASLSSQGYYDVAFGRESALGQYPDFEKFDSKSLWAAQRRKFFKTAVGGRLLAMYHPHSHGPPTSLSLFKTKPNADRLALSGMEAALAGSFCRLPGGGL